MNAPGPAEEALALLEGLRTASRLDALVEATPEGWIVDGRPVEPITGLASSTTEVLFAERVAMHGLVTRSAALCVERAHRAVPTTVGGLWSLLRDDAAMGRDRRLSATVRRLLPSTVDPTEERAHPPAPFVDWLLGIESGHLWRYADAPPFPGLRPLPLDRMWVELHLVEPGELSGLLRGRPLDPEEVDWRREPTSWLLERLGGPTLVLGAPGAGKTTLLRWLARKLVVEGTGRDLLPVFVSLRAYAEALANEPGLSLLGWFVRVECSGDPATLDWLARRNPASKPGLVGLLDGWDEVPASMRRRVAGAIDAMAARSPGMVLTSRRSDCPTSLSYREVFALADLSPAGVEALVRRWCEAVEFATDADALLDALDAHEDVRRMARNPFLLTLLCGLATTTAGGLPRSRTRVYARILALVARQYNSRHGDRRTFGRREAQAVDRLAAWLMRDAHDAPRYVFTPEEVAEATGDDALFDVVLQPSRLVRALHAEDIHHAFLHTTFQEFCAARELARRSEGFNALLAGHGLAPEWLEVFRFLAALGPDRADGWWASLRRAAAHLDRFGVLAVHLATFVAETGAVDGGRSLLGIDLRDVLWQHLLTMPALGALARAFLRLDPADLIARIERELPHTPPRSARRVALTRLLKRIPSPQAEQLLVDMVLTGGREDAAVASYAEEHVLRAAGRRRLRQALRDPALPDETAARVIDTLGNVGDREVVELLSTDLWRRRALHAPIIRALRLIRSDVAIDTLADMLAQAPDEQAGTLLDALSLARTPRARDRLVEHLFDCAERGGRVIRLAATLGALEELPVHHGASLVAHLLATHTDRTVRLAAARALGGAEGPAVAGALKAAAKDPDPALREVAFGAMARHATPEDAQWLSRACADEPAEDARAAALMALLALAEREAGGCAGPRLGALAAEAIDRALRPPVTGPVARVAASHAVAGGAAAEPALLRVLGDPTASDFIRELAIGSLGRLSAVAATPALLDSIGRAPEVGGDEATVHVDGVARCAQAAARALAHLDPSALRLVSGRTAREALAREAHRRQWLVYADGITRHWPTSASTRLVLHRHARCLEVGGAMVTLTPARWAAFELLVRQAGQAIPHLALVRAHNADAADPATFANPATARRHEDRIAGTSRRAIGDIRQRLGQGGEEATRLGQAIAAVPGVGYRLDLTGYRVEADDAL